MLWPDQRVQFSACRAVEEEQILASYPTRYCDQFGEERTFIENDGHVLSMTVRGVEFRGTMLDDFEPIGSPDPDLLKSFCLSNNELCNCTIEYDAPMPVFMRDERIVGNLHVTLTLGEPRNVERGGLDKEELLLALHYNNESYSSRGLTGLFETELLDLQSTMPEHTYIQVCLTCAFSDYHPGGQGLFGGMACFRDSKEVYRAVKNKQDLFRIWGTMTEQVQETYLCPEYERRKPRTGYRG